MKQRNDSEHRTGRKTSQEKVLKNNSSRDQSASKVSQRRLEAPSERGSLTQLFHALDAHLSGDGSLVKAHHLSDVAIVSRSHLLTDHIFPGLCKSRGGVRRAIVRSSLGKG